ncbi:MAG: hypothetical protein NVSMB47_02010 [Polyangiales bacterium]
MRIGCLGGGPGGLHFAGLVKLARPDDDVVVIERERADHTFGFGVVFSDPTLATLAEQDPETYADLLAHCRRWDAIEVRLRGEVVRCHGQGFSAIARKELLRLLQGRARKVGVELRFETEVDGPALDRLLAEFDLVVAADGVSSRLRRRWPEQFRPTLVAGASKFIWFGTTQRFMCLTFLFAENEHGAFAVHAYPFDDQTSTFIVETDEASWRAAGLDRSEPGAATDLRSMEYCRRLFADQLDGHGLLGNDSRWQTFRTLSNESWRHGKVVLLGDAAHTAHFSVGSGTKMAMEDAIALSRALSTEPTLDAACARYETERRAAVDRIQRTAGPSLQWWESFGHTMHFAPEPFTFHFLTRNLRLGRQSLQRRDPRFVAQVDAWSSRTFGSKSILDAPLQLRGLRLGNRLVATVEGDAREGPLPAAGLILIDGSELAHVESTRRAGWLAAVGNGGRTQRAAVGARLAADGGAARLACDAGVDLVELSLALDGPDPVAAFAAVRRSCPSATPIAVRSSSPDPSIDLVRALAAAGCDLLTLGPERPGTDRAAARDAGTAGSDRARNRARISTCLARRDAPSVDEAVTLLLAGRCDLVSIEP